MTMSKEEIERMTRLEVRLEHLDEGQGELKLQVTNHREESLRKHDELKDLVIAMSTDLKTIKDNTVWAWARDNKKLVSVLSTIVFMRLFDIDVFAIKQVMALYAPG